MPLVRERTGRRWAGASRLAGRLRARRSGGRRPRPDPGRGGGGRGHRRTALVLALALLGGVVALGARRAAVTADARGRLAHELRTQLRVRTDDLDATESRVDALRASVAAERGERRRVAAEQARAATDVATLGPAGGWAAVTGAGVRITIANRLGGGSGAADPRVPGADPHASGADPSGSAAGPRGSTAGSGAGPGGPAGSTPDSSGPALSAPAGGRIQDHDLADLVNVLWIAGAEAVAVNGVRLTALSAIRSAGDVVLVGFVAVLAPYVIEAVGDPAALARHTDESAVVDRLRHRPNSPVTSLTVTRASTLTLPAAAAPVLRNARRSGS
ncbi:DUF881 domain-containing protein [Frankia sp. AgB32]|uniref:DUF881 domain-containing protein n=1 Tax=Frankia sp. AgB32 TaxID=631119 RepID=UPI00200DFDBE|nr:DUF881 domain-containing protein [Frankia sp. AgB32]MCK9893917.1 DUF881 domain-containing protein [Frankia sp. AgB32]